MSETLLVAARFVHFASTIALAGCLCFAAAIAPTRWLDAAWRRVAWAALPIIALSGALWFIAQAARMSDGPIADALRPELLSTVLWHTQFGPVFALRLGPVRASRAGALLAHGAGAVDRAGAVGASPRLARLGGSRGGRKGRDHLIHLAADIVHLLAAGAWLGGLPMLALLFHRALAAATADAHDVAREATRRFSVMGLIAVAALLATGIVNTWYLAGSLPALVGTDYGRWLLLKIALFGAMVATAAVNRQVLTPRLALESNDPVRPKARMALLQASPQQSARGRAWPWCHRDRCVARQRRARRPSAGGMAVSRSLQRRRRSPSRNFAPDCGSRSPLSCLRSASSPPASCSVAGEWA